MINREYKGKSLIAFPDNYTVIDIETTGLDYEWCEIIEISALRIRNGLCCESFTSLVKPTEFQILSDGKLKVQYVDSYITELTGITNEMLAEAPDIKEVIPRFAAFISQDEILVGHNVNFDINFLYDAFAKSGITLSNNFIDTMRISRRLLPNLSHHRLIDLAKNYSIPIDGLHRALNDCEITNSCFLSMKRDIEEDIGIDQFIQSFVKNYSAKWVSSSVTDFDITHPLYNQIVVFTGTLSSMVRHDAMQIVADHGGINADNVTKKTNFLVIGNGDFVASVKNGKTGKMKKAESYILSGCDIQILSENAFLSMLETE